MPGVESKRILLLAARQKGLCPRCGQDLVEGAGYDPDDVNDWARWFTRRWIAPAGGRGPEGDDLGAAGLTWTRKREGTTAWPENVER